MKETSFKAGVIGGLCGVFTFLASKLLRRLLELIASNVATNG